MSWSFYNIYGRGRGTRVTATITWLSLAFILVFWTCRLTLGVLSTPDP
jgi:hypothetical protein